MLSLVRVLRLGRAKRLGGIVVVDEAQHHDGRLITGLGGDEVAVPAIGNAGASAQIGPSSRIARFTMPRAGRPLNTLVSAV